MEFVSVIGKVTDRIKHFRGVEDLLGHVKTEILLNVQVDLSRKMLSVQCWCSKVRHRDKCVEGISSTKTKGNAKALIEKMMNSKSIPASRTGREESHRWSLTKSN